jgi:hypothetical protein
MAENSLPILVGAAFGVLITLILLLASKLWTHTVLALFRRWRYQGVSISGEWKGLGTGHTPAAGEWSEVALDLRQHTDDLRGVMTIRHHCAGQSFDLNLQVAGRISNGYATLSLSPVSKTTAAAATALLKIDCGAALNGQLLYRSPFADGVEVINVSVHRAESIAAPRLRPANALPVLHTGTPLAAATGE